MTAQETAWQAAESAAAVLGPEAGMLASVDSAGLGEATLSVLQRAALQPAAVGTAALRFWTSMAMAGPVATARWLGSQAAPPVAVPDCDKRFADKTWTDNPAFFALRQGYLATSQLVSDLLDAGSGDATDDAKARLAEDELVRSGMNALVAEDIHGVGMFVGQRMKMTNPTMLSAPVAHP